MPDFGQNAAAVSRRFRDAVNRERARRLAAGTDVDLAGYGPVALQGRPEDQQTLQGLAFGAQLRIAAGDATLSNFLDRNNVLHQLTPAQLVEVWQAGAAYVAAVYAASWAIKERDPFATNPADPVLWP